MFEQLEVNTYSIAVHASSDEKNTEKSKFCAFSAKLRSVQLAVYTYSIVLHALSDEKNTEKSRFCALFVILLFCTDSKYITYSILNNSLC